MTAAELLERMDLQPGQRFRSCKGCPVRDQCLALAAAEKLPSCVDVAKRVWKAVRA